MAPLRQTAIRLDDQDYALLDEVQRRTGLSSRSDALRYVLRQYAQQHGIGEWGPSRTVARVGKTTKAKRTK